MIVIRSIIIADGDILEGLGGRSANTHRPRRRLRRHGLGLLSTGLVGSGSVRGCHVREKRRTARIDDASVGAVRVAEDMKHRR
jgi:hypothetical protein